MGALAVVNPSQRRTEWLTVRMADRGREFVPNRISLQVRVPTILMGSELVGLQFPLEHLDGGRQRRLRDAARLTGMPVWPGSRRRSPDAGGAGWKPSGSEGLGGRTALRVGGRTPLESRR
jgi:hypothetical protein